MKKIHIVINPVRVTVTSVSKDCEGPGPGRRYTPEQIEFVRKNFPGRSRRSMTELFNRHFGLNITEAKMRSLTGNHRITNGLDGHFSKGNIPFNKGTKGLMKPNVTSFKKGNRPQNYRPVGSERVNVDGYTEVKVADPKTWRLKHRLIWEAAHGPIPRGHRIVFGDGDKANISLDNLILVTAEQAAVMSSLGLFQSDADLTRLGVTIADIALKITERKHNEKKKKGLSGIMKCTLTDACPPKKRRGICCAACTLRESCLDACQNSPDKCGCVKEILTNADQRRAYRDLGAVSHRKNK